MADFRSDNAPQAVSVSGNFFYGQYGGPRCTSVQRDQEDREYPNFLKSKNENLDPSIHGFFVGDVDQEPVEDSNADVLRGCANLYDQVDKKIQVTLRDGRVIVGILVSVDHFSNLILRNAVERIVVGKEYGDISRGVFLIRGDNLVIVGEIDEEREAAMSLVLRKVPVETILVAQRAHQEAGKAKKVRGAHPFDEEL